MQDQQDVPALSVSISTTLEASVPLGGDGSGIKGTSMPVAVDLAADPTTGYVAIQNAVPVLRSVRLTNAGESALDDVQVLISCDPAFAQGKHLRIERLQAGESRLLQTIDLLPEHGYLAGLTEAQKAALKVSVLAGGKEVGRETRPIEVLAANQWAGTHALPELLAAFSMPNNPAIDRLIASASTLLRNSDPSLSMNGYQSKDRTVVWKQVSAIYSAISGLGLHYSEPPASFGQDGQKIRLPDQIVGNKVATCLDLAMLFASCLEQAGLHSVVLFKTGHAWVGVWLHPATFPNAVTDDVQAVRKRAKGGEFLVFETTGVAQHAAQRPSLRLAMEAGVRHLDEELTFAFAIDVKRAREALIRPLPSRAKPIADDPLAAAEQPPEVESPPELPPIDPAVLKPEELAAADTPEGRLAKWKSRLLDLTLRNKLLNFKPTKQSLELVAPDLAGLEDALASGQDFRMRAARALMQGPDHRDEGVHRARHGKDALDEMALEALGKRELLARVSADKLDDALLAIDTAARTGLEEGGANTLYIAIGMLQWADADKAEALHLAPILLLPVTMRRESVKSGYRVKRHDDEALVNPALLQYLKQKFELNIAGLDVVPTDERGIDVKAVLARFRAAVREIARWEVIDQVHLGIFSFQKYLMWKDLQSRTEALKANRVVRHLVENPGQQLPSQAAERSYDRLDETHGPKDIFAPLVLDSSQLNAICAVDDGHDLVLEGPPGTGKSQTITNLIAHTLAKGKTVLFVAEKMAALDVVHKRLTDIGLAPFCLELHSAKASKTGVLQQMGRALEVAGQRTSDEWERSAEQLAVLRSELNGVVEALHRDYPVGLTVFEAIGKCIEHSGEEPCSMPWADPLTHGRKELDTLRETAREMAALAGSLTSLAGHPLAAIGSSQWTPSWEDELLQAAGELDRTVRVLRGRIEHLRPLLGVEIAGVPLERYTALNELLDSVLMAPKVPEGIARAAHDATVRAKIHILAKHGTQRAQAWAQLATGWKPESATLASAELAARWADAQAVWWPKRIFAKSGIRKRLAAYRKDAQPPSEGDLQAMLGPLAAVNAEDAILKPMALEAEALLQGCYAGPDTDWQAVGAHEQWAEHFSNAAVSFAGTDAALADALRASLRPLVAENRASLAPGGAGALAILGYRDALRDVSIALAALKALAKPVEPLQGPAHAPGALERLQSVVASWAEARHQIQPWCLWRAVREKAISQGLQGVVSSLEAGNVELQAVPEHFEFSYQSWWLKKTIDRDAVLRSFSSANHERRIREFRALDERFQDLTKRYVAAVLAGRIPSTTAAIAGADSEMGKLRRELAKQKKLMSVRQLVQSIPTLLPKLKPCLLMSPLSVAQYLEAGHAQFDLVVFDEASQIPTWDAVGAIARGKHVVVVGDPKQLPPTNFFNKSIDVDEADDSDETVEELESILNECLGSGMRRLSLEWHYRSKHESLITFSNHNYYESRLVTFPSPVTQDIAVRFEQVQGTYDRGGSRTNRAEADAIVSAIEAHYLSNRRDRSVGVVTFNQPQQALIEKLLDARRRENAKLDEALAAQRSEQLFVKNLENVQGDERDIILFSITYGLDAAGKMTMNFGPLNSEGGERRLNVAISRAREGVRIFSTLLPEMIDLSRVRAAGVRDLKNYLEFALRGPRAMVEQALPTGREPDSPFELAVIRHLRNAGWEVHPQVGCSGYRVDIGVVDPRAPGRYLVGIECDGAMYHSAATARDRDRLRQLVLERLGWRIHRIWSTDWWRDAEREAAKVKAMLTKLLEQPEPVDAPQARPDDGAHKNISGAGSAPATDAPLPHESTDLAAGAEPSVGPRSPDLPVYVPVELTKHAGDFYDVANNRVIALQLSQVINGEGPVGDVALFRKVARAWGLERTGARIVARLRSLVPREHARSTDGDTTFYWPNGLQPASPTAFRVARDTDEGSKRVIYEVSPEEIGSIVLHVLHASGSAPAADIARTVCRLVGMARTPADAETRVVRSLTRLQREGRVEEASDNWRETSRLKASEHVRQRQ